MMVSFCAVLFPRDVLDEILNLIESVSEGFLLPALPSLSSWRRVWIVPSSVFVQHSFLVTVISDR